MTLQNFSQNSITFPKFTEKFKIPEIPPYFDIIMTILLVHSTALITFDIIVTPPRKSLSCRIKWKPNSASRYGVKVPSTIISFFIVALSVWLDWGGNNRCSINIINLKVCVKMIRSAICLPWFSRKS